MINIVLAIYMIADAPIAYPNQNQPKMSELRKLSQYELNKLIPGSKISTLAPDGSAVFYEIFDRSGRMFSYYGVAPINVEYNITGEGICISNSNPKVCRDVYISKSKQYFYRLKSYKNKVIESTGNMSPMKFVQ